MSYMRRSSNVVVVVARRITSVDTMIITSSISSTSIRRYSQGSPLSSYPNTLLNCRSHGRRRLRPRDLANGGRELCMVHAIDSGWW
jgi:hypothetical protein